MVDIIERLKNDEDYYGEFGSKYLSNSDIDALLNNPREFKTSKSDNVNFAKGRYFHQLILEPQKAVNFQTVDVSTRNTKAYKQYVEDNGLEFAMLRHEAEAIEELVRVMTSNLEMYDMIYHPENKYEVPAISEIHGREWKGKADIVHKDCIIDLKTTGDISSFKWSARKYNYDSQCYIYQKLFGKPLVFYVIDKNTKMMGIYEPTPEFVSYGEEKVIRAIEVYEKFFSKDATHNVDTYVRKEFL